MEILSSARKHGVSDDDIRHAIEHAVGAVTSPTRQHPRDLTDDDVASLVTDLDAAVERGEVTVSGKRALAAVRAAASRRRDAENRVESAVLTAREEGLSWGLIGAQLGITRQGARQRFESLEHR